MENKQEKLKVSTISQIQKQWDMVSQDYVNFDDAPQSVYFSLLYMLQVEKAKNILEVACGSAKMLPMVLNMKGKDASYFATDLSTKMVEQAKIRFQKNFDQYRSSLNFNEWLNENKISFGVANGEEPIKRPQLVPAKFDRIICNLVIHLTEDSQKMLKNLYNEAEEGCLLGVSVMSSLEDNTFFTTLKSAFMEAAKIGKPQKVQEDKTQQVKVNLPKQRQPNYLHNKIQDLASECGWETVLRWEQNALFPILVPQDLEYYQIIRRHLANFKDEQQKEKVRAIFADRLSKVLKQGTKKGIQLGAQMLILRRK